MQVLDQLDGATLLRIEWSAKVNDLLGTLIAQDAHLIEANATPERWGFQLCFHTAADVAAFQQECHEQDISLDITTVYGLRRSEASVDTDSADAALSTVQREVLVAALDGGCFEIPRRTTLIEIAEEIDILDQAVPERLRRTLVKLSTAAVVTNSEE